MTQPWPSRHVALPGLHNPHQSHMTVKYEDVPRISSPSRKDLVYLSRLQTWETQEDHAQISNNTKDESPPEHLELPAITQELGFSSSFGSLPMSSVGGCESDLLPDLGIEMPQMPPAVRTRMPKRSRLKAKYKPIGRTCKLEKERPDSGARQKKTTSALEVVNSFINWKNGNGPAIHVQETKKEERSESPAQQVRSPRTLKQSQTRGRLSMVQETPLSFANRESKATTRNSELSTLLVLGEVNGSIPEQPTPPSVHSARRSSSLAADLEDPPSPKDLGAANENALMVLSFDGRREFDSSRNARRSLSRASEKMKSRFKRIEAKRKKAQKKRNFSQLPMKEQQALIEAFARFDIDNSGYLDHSEVIACLREFGLCGTTPAEKREILRICCEATVSHEDDAPKQTTPATTAIVAIDLLDLALTVVPRVRNALVELRGDELLKEFFKYDVDGSGKLSKAEMKELARGMGLDPRNLDATLVGASSDDEVDFETFQAMIVRGREQLQRVCRDREREVQKLAGLSEADFQDVREDLVGLHDVFLRYDKDRSGSLNKSELTFMLHECGLAPKNAQEKIDIDKIIEESAKDRNNELSFHEFLNIFRAVRTYRQERRRTILVERFHKYDRDGSNNLSSSEISLLLSDLGLVPANRKEQEQLAHLISSVDTDGSGSIDFNEFAELSQKIDEKLKSFRYEEEVECAMCLGFTEKQMRDYRWVFDSLDVDGSQKLDAAEVKNGLNIMNRKIASEVFDSIFAKLDSDGSGELDFLEFVSFMKMLRDGDGAAFTSDDVQKLATKAKNLDTRVLRRVLEYFRLAKHYINSLSHDDLVGLFCEFFKVQPNTNLHDALDVRTVADLYEAAQKRDQAMQGNMS